MALQPGTRLGPYEIAAQIGVDGMIGVGGRARDVSRLSAAVQSGKGNEQHALNHRMGLWALTTSSRVR